MEDLIYSFHYTNNKPAIGRFDDGYILAYDAVGEGIQPLFHDHIAEAVGYRGSFEASSPISIRLQVDGRLTLQLMNVGSSGL